MTDERVRPPAGDPVYGTEHARLKWLIGLANRTAARSRGRRQRRFAQLLDPKPGTRILDVGCGAGGGGPAAFLPEADVTGIDLHPPEEVWAPGLTYVQGDARELPFDDDSFDIAYSNSVIEHVERSDRPGFAAGLRRVARAYWVQTPDFWFPIEPHALLPGAQFLPRSLRRVYWRASPRRLEWEDSLALLRPRELRALFPDAIIVRERVGPLTKSLIAVGPRELLAEGRRRAGW